MRKLFSFMFVAIVAWGMTSCQKYDSLFPQEEGAWLVDGQTFSNLIRKTFSEFKVSSIYFEADCPNPMPAKAIDVSDDEDQSAWAVLEGDILYIRTQKSTFTANADCSKMFMELCLVGLKGIHFNNVFNTHNVTNMNLMFGLCSDTMLSLDLSGFDTSNVTDMKDMFINNRALSLIDIRSFNTKNVQNFSTMFRCCGYNTGACLIMMGDGFVFNSRVEAMDCDGMFQQCGGDELNIALVGCPLTTEYKIDEWSLINPI